MSHAIVRMRQEGRRVVRRLRQIETADMTEAEPQKSLPDVPMHQRGFGLMDDDVP